MVTSELESDFVQAKNNFNEFKEFANDLGLRWKDEKKEEFYKKFIVSFIVSAEPYLNNCKELIYLIEEAHNFS
jgi:hypothetical protein